MDLILIDMQDKSFEPRSVGSSNHFMQRAEFLLVSPIVPPGSIILVP